MSDSWDESFVPLSPYAYEAHRWQRYASEPPIVSGAVCLIAVASLVLAGFVAADVGALSSTPVKVTVTQIRWFVGNASVGNQSGFTMRGGQSVSLSAVCQLFCPNFVGVTVDQPFTLVNYTIAYPWFEYLNVTVQAPSNSYTGPLTIVAQVP